MAWATQSASLIGSALNFFAINVWLATSKYPELSQKSQLAWALSALSLAFAIPTVFAAPLAGAWADRHDRRTTMLAMDAASALLTAATVLLILTHHLGIPGLIVVGVLGSTFRAFHSASFDTSYAMLVVPERLPRANAMMQTMDSLSGVAAPALAAMLIALPALARQGAWPGLLTKLAGIHEGAALAIGLDSVSFFLSALVLLFLHIPSPRRPDLAPGDGPKKSFADDMGEGVRYLAHRPPLLALLATFTLANLAGGLLVLQPLVVKYQLGADWKSHGMTFESALALISTALGLGGIAGGMVLSAWGGLKHGRVRGVLAALLGGALMGIGYGLSSWIYASAGLMFLWGFLIPCANVHSQAIWQAQVPFELQGRVFSVRRLIAQISWPLSSFVFGALASRFEAGRIISLTSLLVMVATGVAAMNPGLRRVEDRAELERVAELRKNRVSAKRA